jgi:hypothetical protein
MSKYNEFAVGWLKENKNKGQYVAAIVSKGNPKTGKPGVAKISVEYENGEVAEISNFAVFFNENKKSEKAPDVQFVFSTDN